MDTIGLNDVFKGYKIKAECIDFKKANHFNIFHIKLHPGCRVRTLENLTAEIQLGMRLSGKPIFMLSPSTGMLKMIVADKAPIIDIRDLINGHVFSELEVYLGVDSEGNILDVDLEKMPHLIVAGATGSGKSVFLHTLIANFILGNRKECIKLHLFDPKLVEFEQYKMYRGHVFIDVKNRYDEIILSFERIAQLMEHRFMFLSENGYKSVADYNNANNLSIPRIICIVDELADLMLQDKKNKVFERLICSIAAKSRAAGIHLILSTQRPSVDVLTGLIKANFPTRVCFKVSSYIDSRVVLDYKGAENLMSKGDGILSGYNDKPVRFQSAFTDPTRILRKELL